MSMKKSITVYGFDELNEKVQNKIIRETIEFLLETYTEDTFSESCIVRAIKKASQMKTPWLAAEYVYDYCENLIIASVHGYEYLKNGSIAPE